MVWISRLFSSTHTSAIWGEGCRGGLSGEPYHPLYNLVSPGGKDMWEPLEHNVFTTSRGREALSISREVEKVQ